SESEAGALPNRKPRSEFWVSAIVGSGCCEIDVVAGRRIAVVALHSQAPGCRAGAEGTRLLMERPALHGDDEPGFLQLAEPPNHPLRAAPEAAHGFPMAVTEAAIVAAVVAAPDLEQQPKGPGSRDEEPRFGVHDLVLHHDEVLASGLHAARFPRLFRTSSQSVSAAGG